MRNLVITAAAFLVPALASADTNWPAKLGELKKAVADKEFALSQSASVQSEQAAEIERSYLIRSRVFTTHSLQAATNDLKMSTSSFIASLEDVIALRAESDLPKTQEVNDGAIALSKSISSICTSSVEEIEIATTKAVDYKNRIVNELASNVIYMTLEERDFVEDALGFAFNTVSTCDEAAVVIEKVIKDTEPN